jgi:hypothetical protein
MHAAETGETIGERDPWIEYSVDGVESASDVQRLGSVPTEQWLV